MSEARQILEGRYVAPKTYRGVWQVGSVFAASFIGKACEHYSDGDYVRITIERLPAPPEKEN